MPARMAPTSGRGRALALAGVLLLAACASEPPPPEPLAEDEPTASSVVLARDAFRRERYQQAAGLYRKALLRAYARDDLTAIADVGYELALTLYRGGHFAQAIDLAERTRDELRRRGGQTRERLELVEAWARYRSGDVEGASRLVADITRATGSDARGEVLLRARVLAGYLAHERRDAGELAAVLAALPPAEEPVTAGDVAELGGHLAMLRGEAGRAVEAYLDAVALRRAVGDVAGVTRGLAQAAEASEAADEDTRAADLYLRATRSALAAREPVADTADVTRWVESAMRLARGLERPDLRAEAERLRREAAGMEEPGAAPGPS